ncbi:MAG TPA: hypothetical protein PLI09_08385 [Candidatus Hydrogenedentes bacterium]|nr:hypothetical protein [Candidatus Hydrogenedentota bacterium]
MSGLAKTAWSWESAQIFLTSLTLMLFEINLIRLFSITANYHLSFFVLAIALFGIGLGGVYGQILQQRRKDRRDFSGIMSYLPVLLSLSILAATAGLIHIPLKGSAADSMLFNVGGLLFLFLMTAMPFFFGGLFVSMIFASWNHTAARLYFCDLAGAGIGCVLAVTGLEWLGGTYMPFFIAFMALLPLGFARGGMRRKTIIGACALLTVILVLAGANNHWGLFQFKSKQIPGQELLLTKWNFYSCLEFKTCPEWRGWRPSSQYPGPFPDHVVVTQDGRAPTYITHFDGDYDKVKYLRYDFTALPFYTLPAPKALIIGVGGGRDILTAKMFDVSSITGVELNPNLVSAMQHEFCEYSGNVYGLPGVDIAVDNGRTFVHQTKEHYDLIVLSMTDTQLALSQGAYVLTENYLYTAEAFGAYWDHLTPQGAFCTNTGLLRGDMIVRLVSTAASMLESKGVAEPGKHILVFMTDPVVKNVSKGMCMVVSKDPLTAEAVARGRLACNSLGYRLVWSPLEELQPQSGDVHYWLSEKLAFTARQPELSPEEWAAGMGFLMRADSREVFIRAQHIDLSPLKDDRPYLFYGTKPSRFIPSVLSFHYAEREVAQYESGFYFILNLFLAVFTGVMLLMLSPLVLFQHAELGGAARQLRMGFLAVCFMVGAAYMIIEVSILQQLFLLLGDPTITFAVTLGVMLAFTGVGSLISGGIAPEQLWGFLWKAAGAVTGIQCCAWLFLPGVFGALQGADMWVKLSIVAGVLAILAIPMGMVFPSLLRLTGLSNLNMTCWMWGMNGVGSVLGSVTATIISMNCGNHVTYLMGILLYACICLIMVYLKRTAEQHFSVTPGATA